MRLVRQRERKLLLPSALRFRIRHETAECCRALNRFPLCLVFRSVALQETAKLEHQRKSTEERTRTRRETHLSIPASLTSAMRKKSVAYMNRMKMKRTQWHSKGREREREERNGRRRSHILHGIKPFPASSPCVCLGDKEAQQSRNGVPPRDSAYSPRLKTAPSGAPPSTLVAAALWYTLSKPGPVPLKYCPFHTLPCTSV